MDRQLEEATQEFQRWYGLVLSVARRYAPSPEWVQDVVQQVFIDFVTATLKGNRDPSRDLAPYLHQITRNRALKFWREERHRQPEIQQRIGERLARLQRQRNESDEEANRQLEQLRRCTGELPEKSRRLIERHYFQGSSLEEIARDESIPSGTLRKAMYRIRIQLRDCMERK